MKKQSVLSCILHFFSFRHKTKAIPVSLQEAIEACITMEQLKILLLSKEVILDEQMMAAFDKRIAQLEQATGQPFLF